MLNDEENTIVVQFRIYKRKQKKETNMRRVHENNHATAAIISSYNLQKQHQQNQLIMMAVITFSKLHTSFSFCPFY